MIERTELNEKLYKVSACLRAGDTLEAKAIIWELCGRLDSAEPLAVETVCTLTEYIDREAQTPHGVFSSPGKAQDAIRELARSPRFHKDDMTATDRATGNLWLIDQYTLDAIS